MNLRTRAPRACLLALLAASLNLSPLARAQAQTTPATTPAPAAQAAKPQTVAFVGVNVVPMDRERVVADQTVVVRDGRIVEVGPASKTKVPDGALRVDGRGKYLMPGLAEMHGHLPHPSTPAPVADSILLLFVANGVTTVRGMFGFPNHVQLRERAARNELLSPTLYVAGPALSGQSVQSASAADALVREHKQAGYDLLKVHEGLSREAYDRIVATANELKIPFGGHVAEGVGLLHAIKSKQSSVEHMDGYLEALEADDSPIRDADPQTRAQKLLQHLDERKLPALAAATRDAGIWVTPTQALWQTFFSSESTESLKQRPELKYVPPQMVAGWVKQRANMQQQGGPPPADAARIIQLRDRILKALADANAPLLLGSDAPQLFSVPGFSLHREMQAMAKAGLTPYQILASGTLNPARYWNAENEFGTVQAGRRADLILLDADPLKDISNVARRSGVMLRGRWLPEAELRRMLDALAAQYAPPK